MKRSSILRYERILFDLTVSFYQKVFALGSSVRLVLLGALELYSSTEAVFHGGAAVAHRRMHISNRWNGSILFTVRRGNPGV